MLKMKIVVDIFSGMWLSSVDRRRGPSCAVPCHCSSTGSEYNVPLYRLVYWLVTVQLVSTMCCFCTDSNKKFQSNLGRAASLPIIQRMDSSAPCATSCAIPTVDESNHSAAGSLHPHYSATFFLFIRPTLRCPIPLTKKIGLSLWGIPTHTIKKVIHRSSRPTTPNDISA